MFGNRTEQASADRLSALVEEVRLLRDRCDGLAEEVRATQAQNKALARSLEASETELARLKVEQLVFARRLDEDGVQAGKAITGLFERLEQVRRGEAADRAEVVPGHRAG